MILSHIHLGAESPSSFDYAGGVWVCESVSTIMHIRLFAIVFADVAHK